MAKTEVIELKEINVQHAKITICGDGNLVLNKMNDVTVRQLTDARKDKAKDTAKKNVWEEIITSMHWYKGKPTDFSEEGLEKALIENALASQHSVSGNPLEMQLSGMGLIHMRQSSWRG